MTYDWTNDRLTVGERVAACIWPGEVLSEWHFTDAHAELNGAAYALSLCGHYEDAATVREARDFLMVRYRYDQARRYAA